MRKIPHCCLPKESGPCLSPRPADRPLRPATRRRLGRPLPPQLADRPQTPPEANCSFSEEDRCPPATFGISPGFPGLSPTSGQVVYVLLDRSPLANPHRSRGCSFDLHTLGTPLAFVLSQDQTLHGKLAPSPHYGAREIKSLLSGLVVTHVLARFRPFPLSSFQRSLWPALPPTSKTL